MGLQLPFGIDPTNPISVDVRYGPWVSLAAAKAGVPLALRFDGLTVQITGSGEYHWLAADLSDAGLIIKTAGGGGGTPPGGIVRQVYLVNDASTATAMGGVTNNVYTTAQAAYNAANTLQLSLPAGSLVQLMVGSTRQADVGDITVAAGWNNFVTVVGIDNQTSQIRDIIGDDTFGVQGITLYNVLVNSLKGRATTPTGDGPGVDLSGSGFAVNTIDTSLTNAGNTGTTGYINVNGSGYIGTITSTTTAGLMGGCYLAGAVASNGAVFSNTINISGKDDVNGFSITNGSIGTITYNQTTSAIAGANWVLINTQVSSLSLSIAGAANINIEGCNIGNTTVVNTVPGLGSITFNANDSALSNAAGGGNCNFTNTANVNYARVKLTGCSFHFILNLPATSFLFNCVVYNNIQSIGASCQIVTTSIQGGSNIATPLASITNATAVTVITNGSYLRGISQSTITITNVNNTPTTKAALIALIGASKLVIGTTYVVTDAQDALGGTVSVLATSTNTINGNGVWSFVGKLPAQGRFRLNGGTSGSVDQISVVMPTGTKNLMTASIPYTTSRNNTATLVVANINANTGVSGCRAWVIASPAGGFDTPRICIEALDTTTAFVHTMVVTVTTLTINDQQNPTIGFTANNLNLISNYDLTNDRIIYAADASKNCSMSITVARITAIGFNPIVNFRWGDIRLIGFNFVESGYRNVTFRLAANQVWRNWSITATSSFDGIIFGTGANQNNVFLGAQSQITNVNSNNLLLNAISNVQISFSGVEAGNISVTTQSGSGIAVSNSVFGTSATPAAVSLGSGTAAISLTTYIQTGTQSCTITGNEGVGKFIVLNNVTATRAVIFNNKCLNGITLQSTSTMGFFDIEQCILNGAIFLSNNTHGGGGFSVLYSVINSGGNLASNNGLSATGCSFASSAISNSTFTILLVNGSDLTSGFAMDSAYIDPNCSFGKFVGSGNFSVFNSELRDCIFGTSTTTLQNLDINSSTLKTCECSISNSNTINNSQVSNFRIFELGLSGLLLASSVYIADSYVSFVVVNEDLDSTDGLFIDFFLSGNPSFPGTGSKVTNTTFYAGVQSMIQFLAVDIDNSNIWFSNNTAGAGSYLQNSKINNSTFKSRASSSSMTYDGYTLLNSSWTDDALIGIWETIAVSKTYVENSIISCGVVGTGWEFTNCKYFNTTLATIGTVSLFRNTTIENDKFIFRSGKITLAALPTPYFFTNLPKGFIFRLLTYSSDQSLANATFNNIGYSGATSIYLNAVGSTINANPAAESPTGIQGPLSTEKDLQYFAHAFTGAISFTIEGFHHDQ